MSRGAGDPVTNCAPSERPALAEREHEGVETAVLGGVRGGSTEARMAAKDKESSTRAAAEGQSLCRWENGDFSFNIDVILRPESTRKTERQLTWARERHNRFSR